MHFFIDHTKLPIQSSLDKYGPVDGGASTKYKVTSKFQLEEDASAFACEDCMMVVQESNENPLLVNVILEPVSSSGKVTSKVKYYIYRGILKASLLTADGTALVPKSSTNNEFIQRIYNARLDVDLYNAGILGYSNSMSTDKSINEIFRSSNINIAPIQIKEGEWFGEFVSSVTGETGFEIILEPEKITVDIEFVKNNQTVIDVSNLTGSTLRARREAILAFVDPVAFFGSYQKTGVNTSTYSGQTKTTIKKKEAELYTDVLSKFFTKDRLYLDIRSDKGYSYNYYQDYQYIVLNHNATFQNYETEGWPVIYLENIANLSFKLRTDGNIKPLIYIESKSLKSKNQNTPFFDDLIDDADPGWTKDIDLTIPSKPYYVKMHYFHSAIDQTSPSPFVRNNRYYDHAFCSIDLIPDDFSSPSSKLREVENSNPVYIGEELNNNGHEGGFKYIANNGAFWDEGKVLFYSNLKVQYRTTGLKYPNPVKVSKLDLNSKAFSDKIGRYLTIETRLFENKDTSGPHEEDIKIISITNCETNNLKERESALFLGLTVAEMEAVKTAAYSLDSGHHTYLFLEPYLGQDGPPVYFDGVTNVGLAVYQYQLKVQGLDSNGDLAYAVPTKSGSPILVYSIDRFFYNSKEFSANKTPDATNQVEFHIYHNKGEVFQKGKMTPSYIQSGNRIKYIYHHENGNEYTICECDIIEIDGVSNGNKYLDRKNRIKFTSVPPNGTKKDGLMGENTSYDFYYYANKDIWVTDNGTHGIIKYESLNKRVFMVRFIPSLFQEVYIDGVKFRKLVFPINNQNLIILTKSERMYLNPKVMAAFLGALIRTIQFTHYFNGGAYSNGTCYISVAHASGASYDMRYQDFGAGNEIPDLNDGEETPQHKQAILHNQSVIDAMRFYRFQTIYVGKKSKYQALKNVTPYDDHNNHIHFGNLAEY